jgi:hypothetical protein
MCDVVIAAAQTLTWDDLSMLTEADRPSPSGLVVLPHPVLVTALNGNIGDDRAYLWHTPAQMPKPDPTTRGWVHVPAVRISQYHDSHGPVGPDSFLDFADHARAQGHPLPDLHAWAAPSWCVVVSGSTAWMEQAAYSGRCLVPAGGGSESIGAAR